MSFSTWYVKWRDQISHTGWGWAVVQTVAYSPRIHWHDPRRALETLVGWIIFAAWKEFWFDIHYETPELSGMWKGGLLDFSTLVLGGVVGYVLGGV